jgi:radical SAM-linked protein
MTIAQPLSVGVTSESEFMKVGFEDGYKPREIVEILNNAFPPGFKVYSCFKLNAKEIDITLIDKARYIVEIEHTGDADIDAFMANSELIVPKKTKSGIKDSDIREHIFEIKKISDVDGVLTLEMLLSVGSAYNLKPETVVDAMEKYCDGFRKIFMTIHRKEMLGGNVERLVNIV